MTPNNIFSIPIGLYRRKKIIWYVTWIDTIDTPKYRYQIERQINKERLNVTIANYELRSQQFLEVF